MVTCRPLHPGCRLHCPRASFGVGTRQRPPRELPLRGAGGICRELSLGLGFPQSPGGVSGGGPVLLGHTPAVGPASAEWGISRVPLLSPSVLSIRGPLSRVTTGSACISVFTNSLLCPVSYQTQPLRSYF